MSFWACSKRVWNMCWALRASATDKMVTQQARRSPFCVLSSILNPHSQSLTRLPPSSRTYSIVCSHASCSRSLARFLPASPTRSVVYFFSVFFPPSLPLSFTNSLVCLLSPSFLPFKISLDVIFHSHSLTHTHFLASLPLDKHFTRSLSTVFINIHYHGNPNCKQSATIHENIRKSVLSFSSEDVYQ